MARVQVKSLGWGTVWDQAGNVQPDVTVSIIEQGGSEASLYAASTGVATVDSVTDSNGQVPGFLDEGVYTVTNPSFGTFSADVVSGFGTNTALSLLRDAPINVMDATYGAVGDDVADDSAPIQAALDAAEAAGGGTVFFPPGTYRCLTALTYATDVPVNILGSGAPGRGITSGGTILHFPNDLGVGTYALSSSTPSSGSGQGVLRDFKLLGNGTYTDGAGTAPCAMNGLRVNRSQTLYNVVSEKFSSAYVLWGDHTAMTSCKAFDSKYGVYWSDSAVAQSDQYFRSLLVDSCFAGLAVGGGVTIDQGIFEGTHLANVAIGIYRETQTANHFMDDTVFNGLDVETWGNALIYDEAWAAADTTTDSINNVTFEGFRQLGAFDASVKVAAKTSVAAINVWGLFDCTFVGEFHDSVGSTSIVRMSQGDGNDFGVISAANVAAQAAGKPPFAISSGAHVGNRGWIDTGCGVELGRLCHAGQPITQFDLVKHLQSSFGNLVARWATGTIPAGVAQHARSTDGTLVVVVDGYAKVNSGGNAISALDYVKGDATAGQIVKTSANPGVIADHPIVGHAIDASSGGFTKVRLRISY